MKAQILALITGITMTVSSQAELRCHIMKENPQVRGQYDQTLWQSKVSETNTVKEQVSIFVLKDGRALNSEELQAELMKLRDEKKIKALMNTAVVFGIGPVEQPAGFISLTIARVGEKPTGVFTIAKSDRFVHLADMGRGYTLSCYDPASMGQ